MNNLSHIIRKFNRFELKYVLTLQQAELFRNALMAYLMPDDHGNGNGSYPLASLYYDSTDLRCYWEKIEGLKFRRKLRIRRYEKDEALNENTPVFIEIKQRVDRVTQKRRAILNYGEALRLCNERKIPDQYAPDDKDVIDEVYAFLSQYDLRATSIVRYHRQAFIGNDYDIGLRVTFDTDLTSQVHTLSLDKPLALIPILPANLVIMEIKVNERIPYWLTELVAKYNLRITRISKYCKSIEVASLVVNP